MMRKALIVIALLAGILGVSISYNALLLIWETVSVLPKAAVGLLALAVLMQVVGHIYRARRTKLILDQAAKSSSQFQFGMLSIGYLFNALLPFRLGELVRAMLVARRLRISMLYTFASIVIERVVDILLLGFLIIVGAVLLGGSLIIKAAIVASGLMALAIVVFAGLLLLMSENKQILSLVKGISSWFNPRINNSIRFKVWSLIFGLQQFFGNRDYLRRYIAYAAVSWALYFSSAYLILQAIISDISGVKSFVAVVASYVVTIPAWGFLDNDSFNQLSALLPGVDTQTVVNFGLLSWGVLVLPMAAIGVVSLLSYKIDSKNTAVSIAPESFNNKLSRHDDISQEFPAFLESYFSGNSLARILHRLEAKNDLRLVKFFKGGSDAITILVLSDKEMFVKKIIPTEFEDRLKAQYLWLKRHKKMPHLVQVVGEQKADEYYAIDLEYDPENVPLFEFIHHGSFDQSREIVLRTWKTIHGELYKSAKKPILDESARDKFIEKHMIGCLEKAIQTNADLAEAVKSEKITINGKSYDNFHTILKKIKNNQQAWTDIATFSHSNEVHGDMAIDNVLVSPRTLKPVIIDPAPDGNIINGPVFDFGKLSQSFYCGYEFLFRDNEAVSFGNNSINYRDHISERYNRMWHFLSAELAPKYLSEEEQRSMLFHAAALHIRVLKHRVYINPDNVVKFYAVGVKTLNDFLAQYEK